MKVLNIHERSYRAAPEVIGALIDSLSGPDDSLWPRDKWPAQTLDGPLGEGAGGGHGPVKYTVCEYIPGRRVAYRFDPAGLIAGFDGRHYFEVVSRRHDVLLRHVLEAQCDMKTWLRWKMVVEPLHDALVEDALDGAEHRLHGRVERPANWSPWVKGLRRILAKRRQKKV
jgi:hypothetical protein